MPRKTIEQGVIYKITSPSNKIYIGQTSNFKNRMSCYKAAKNKTQVKLYNSLIKYNLEIGRAHV